VLGAFSVLPYLEIWSIISSMWARISLLFATVLCSSCALIAYPAPMPGSENIPKMMAEATLVCKGEVTAAPVPISRTDGTTFKVTATVRMDRCYKENAVAAEVEFDGVTSPAVVLDSLSKPAITTFSFLSATKRPTLSLIPGSGR